MKPGSAMAESAALLVDEVEAPADALSRD